MSTGAGQPLNPTPVVVTTHLPRMQEPWSVVQAQPSNPAPAPTQPASTPSNPLEAGFTTTLTALPQGFPILPEALFVAYNPAFDPCAQPGMLCPVRQFPPQVWLFEIDLSADPEATIRDIAGQFTALLEASGYQVESMLTDDATVLTFTGPAGSQAPRGSIVIGPRVTTRTLPADSRVIGLRIVIEEH